MSDQPKSRLRAKPHFSRRFLWLLILLLLPLIPFLDSLGPDEVYQLPEQTSEPVSSFAASRVFDDTVSEVRGNVPVIRLPLPEAPEFRLSVVSDRQPAELPPLPQGVTGESVFRYGRWVLNLVIPYDGEPLEALAEYLMEALPPATRDTGYVLSGPWTDEVASAVVGSLVQSDAPSYRVDPPGSRGVVVYTSPYPDEPGYWSFVLAMDLLDQRLGGYRAEMHWNQQVRPAEVALTTSLLPEQRGLPDSTDFENSRRRLLRAVAAEERSLAGWHQQLIWVAAYNLAPRHLAEREQRVGTLSFDEFARTWENLIGPTSSENAPPE